MTEPPPEPLFTPPADEPPPERKVDLRYTCAVCHEKLQTHELPAAGNPGLCDRCARSHRTT